MSYVVKFSTTDADAKKLLAYCRKNYGGGYKKPVLNNFKEGFTTPMFKILYKTTGTWKASEVQRSIPVNGKPSIDILNHHAQKMSAMYGITIQDAMDKIKANENGFYDAIGQALLLA